MDRTELEAQVAYLLAAVDTSDDAVLSLDSTGRIAQANRGARRLFGWGEQLTGAAAVELVADHDRAVWERCLAFVQAGGPVEAIELSVRRRDGVTIPTRVTATPVRAPDGGLLGASVVVRDIAEQRLAQATLADNAARVAQSEALAHVGSWAWDAGTDAVQWSAEQHRIHGLSPREFDGTLEGHLAHVHRADRPGVTASLHAAVLNGAPLDLEFRVVRPDRTVRWVDARASVVVGPDGRAMGLRGIYHDTTERQETAQVLQEANERLTELALYDRLTGLPNRTLLVDRLGRSLRRSRELGARVDLMYVGVDDFKTINDSAGHDAGDQVLVALAPVLGRALGRPLDPEAGRVLARLGGDEFAIVLDDGDAGGVAEEIRDLLQEPLQLPDDQVFLSVSIGSAFVRPPRHDATAEGLLAEANIAMHEAKRGGKSRFVSFEPRMHEDARQRHRLGHDLHTALAENQFVVEYQPVVDLAVGTVTGAEALVRWQHPTRGLVAPGEFIARAEETGLIVPLGAWVLRIACVQAVTWQSEADRPLRIAVNVSGRQLREPDFVEMVRAALHDSGLPSSSLCLEMTESILMERDEAGLAQLTALREDGVHLAIDDFGTGYSSLAALRRLPVDQLKIDRSFVAGLPGDDDAATIAWAIVHLGHALGLEVLAEGVETREQQAELMRFGCDVAQGFLFGRSHQHLDPSASTAPLLLPPAPRAHLDRAHPAAADR